MGYSLPAAIGACLALRKRRLFPSRDGGFQINIQELETVVRNKLPYKMVVINTSRWE